MSSHTHWSKLQSIYAALDSYQYTKAIKLCMQQPATNILARVLLVHALAKSGQRSKSLQVIASILSEQLDFFPELRLELQYALPPDEMDHGAQGHASTATQGTATQSVTAAKKGKGKGKKKASSAVAPSSSSPEQAVVVPQLDWIDRLDNPPRLPEDWDHLPPPSTADWLQDEHTLSTLTMTMYKILRLPLTAFHLYRWSVQSASSNKSGANPLILAKAYLAGLPVLVAPQYTRQQSSTDTLQPPVTRTVLQHMQSLALQLARQCSQTKARNNNKEYEPLAILWAAQACLWQVDLERGDSDGSTPTTTRSDPTILLRLAESLAARGLDSHAILAPAPEEKSDFLLQSEYFMLYMDILDRQGKLQEQLDAINKRLGGSTIEEEEELVYPPRRNLLDMKAKTLQDIGNFTEAQEVLASQLYLYPDNWSFWKRHAECCASSDNVTCTYDLAMNILENERLAAPNGILRGPRLIKVELAYAACRERPETDENLSKLVDEIIRYANDVAPRALCCFSDLEPYLNYAVDQERGNQFSTSRLLNWLKSFCRLPNAQDDATRRRELRQYIAGVQMTHRVLSSLERTKKTEEMPDWDELLKVWKDFQSYDVIHADDPKENRPADELILLAVQQILLVDPIDETKLVLAACILEAGMRYSPFNATLKIAAVRVYGSLHAGSRAYELYKTLYIKHIQYESCAYLIIPILTACGLYEETIDVSKEIMRLQRLALNESAEYSAKAMENGARSKADEFVRFQRGRINESLTALEARGLILDAAPMFGQKESQWFPGAVHGIVGSTSDLERALQMITEAHDPLGAFNILQVTRKACENVQKFSDNRDRDVLIHETLCGREIESADSIIQRSVARGRTHALLIRATLCVAASKGPKKGKLVDPSDELKKRCSSLLDAIEAALDDCSQLPKIRSLLLNALVSSARVIAGLNTGVFDAKDVAAEKTLDGRELKAASLLATQKQSLQMSLEEYQTSDENGIALTSRLLSEFIIPLFAVCQMQGILFELYGWGKRKRISKICAGSLADVCGCLSSLVVALCQKVECLPKTYESPLELGGSILDILDPSLCGETIMAIRRSQETTYERITGLCSEIRKDLSVFDVQD